MEFKLPALPKDTKPFCLGALAGAVAIAWIGFDSFGWKTSAASETLAKRQADGAVVAAYAHICASEFSSARNSPARLAELKKVDQWARGEAVAKGGFATMAGEKEPTYGVGQACADLLIPGTS